MYEIELKVEGSATPETILADAEVLWSDILNFVVDESEKPACPRRFFADQNTVHAEAAIL
jgi:hypothetical protein